MNHIIMHHIIMHHMFVVDFLAHVLILLYMITDHSLVNHLDVRIITTSSLFIFTC